MVSPSEAVIYKLISDKNEKIERLTAEVERLNSLVNYEVVTADPEGYWLCPLNVTDPALWAWMLLPSPVDEIDRLRRIPETASREVVQLDSAELRRRLRRMEKWVKR